jgi:hypothetical protein
MKPSIKKMFSQQRTYGTPEAAAKALRVLMAPKPIAKAKPLPRPKKK